MVINIILVISAYLLGSIPSAVYISRKYYGLDIREHGSKNAGATNVLRVLGRKAALTVFIVDFLKGFAAVTLSLLSEYTWGSDQIIILKIVLVVAAVAGHIFPIFAGFRGGKGVATLAGAVLALYPAAVLVCLAVFLIMLAFTHYVSLSSMTAGVVLPLVVVFVFKQTYPPLVIFCCIITILLFVTHRKNIKRLIKGTESKTYLIKTEKF